jgi:hypothetical protein
MAKKLTPASLAKQVTGKMTDLLNTNPQSGVGSSLSSLKNFGKGLESLILREAMFFVVLFLIAIVIIGVVVIALQFVIVIINKNAYLTPNMKNVSYYDNGGPGFSNPTSCPLQGGQVSLGSYDPSNENNRSGGHGSSYYWTQVYTGNCYHIPQRATECAQDPDGNRCSGGSTCPYYGFAADIFGGGPGTPVYLPLVDGESVNWTCKYLWTTSAGSTVDCTTTSGAHPVSLTMTHVNIPSSYPTDAPSGTRVTSLYDQGGNTHMHLEAQVDGSWVPPEKYFCGGATP